MKNMKVLTKIHEIYFCLKTLYVKHNTVNVKEFEILHIVFRLQSQTFLPQSFTCNNTCGAHYCWLANISVPLCFAEECDYDCGPHLIKIPANNTKAMFNVTIYDDDLFETDEYFMLIINEDALPNFIELGYPYNSTVTIKDGEDCKYFI